MIVRGRNAQSIVEYSIIFVVVALALASMKMYMVRSVKASFKVLQEQVTGNYSHNDAEGPVTIHP